MAGNVDGEVAELQHFALRFGIGMHAAQQRANAGNQFAGAERLDEVVVGAELQADDAVFDFALRREHDDGHVGIVANRAAHALARHAGKHEVEDNQVEMVLREFVKGVLPVADCRNPIVLALEIGGHRVADRLLVFNQHDTACLVAHRYSFSVRLLRLENNCMYCSVPMWTAYAVCCNYIVCNQGVILARGK